LGSLGGELRRPDTGSPDISIFIHWFTIFLLLFKLMKFLAWIYLMKAVLAAEGFNLSRCSKRSADPPPHFRSRFKSQWETRSSFFPQHCSIPLIPHASSSSTHHPRIPTSTFLLNLFFSHLAFSVLLKLAMGT